MSRVRAKGNKSTELRLISLLRAEKIKGWRRHPALVGNPDFIFRKARVVIFVDGCFWHGCPKHGRVPKSNQDFWVAKITANKQRDRFVSRTLKLQGWQVLRIWEHDLRGVSASVRVMSRIRTKLNANS
jgi:DNA mismatch endonuclease (patch repair protein)